MEELLVRYAHFLGIIFLASMLAIENVLLSKILKREVVGKLAIIDSLYGLSAIVTLTAGLLLWFAVGKPSQFYTSNVVFHAKVGLFVLIALLSILPTLFFLKSRRLNVQEILVPKHIIYIVRLEVVLLLLLPLLAVLMARGYGAA
ncbi:DUF2214 family protein [Thiomicrorhabdus sp. ZW0627]|uniref:DUF2214 family protein n=1 Tax=Thiomicrorhabdus sp. ZW0627 TaxID=3039774 RepID=UPI002436DFC9|nr:DUF2214 family protein [Thiomicrorhabdus sp. ZW0627]MDG6774602.1 DUF2214 family protein [Thiomicrorhabdus sp. ZW0627]